MTAHSPFLEAVKADPDSDLPRLVYADFLDETGDHTRAGFIRLQLSQESAPKFSNHGGGTSHETLKTFRNCHRENGCVWCGMKAKEWEYDLDGFTRGGRRLRLTGTNVKVVFRRGFVDGVNGPLAELIRYLPGLAAGEWVRPSSVYVEDRRPYGSASPLAPFAWADESTERWRAVVRWADWTLPPPVFSALTGHRSGAEFPFPKMYRTQAEARLALAEVLLSGAGVTA